MRRPLIQNKGTAIVVGGALVAVGMTVLYDAWEGRGGKTPWFLGPLKWW